MLGQTSSRRVRVAAIQVTSVNGEVERNLGNAGRYVAEAASRGAELAVCPEFLAAGYVFDEVIWESAEPAGGPTETWLQAQAKRHGILVGAGFLEAEGEELYNTFSLFGPGGLIGRVRKGSLPFFEGWYFRPCARSKVIETGFGRVGVGICHDNQTAGFLRHMVETRPELILMPHSAPTPRIPVIDRFFRRVYEGQLRQTPGRYARTLGVPVVMANKVAFDVTRSPVPVLPGVRVPFEFHGYSTICDADGHTAAFLRDAEGAVVADVTVGGHRPSADVRPSGYWSFGPRFFPRVTAGVLRALDALGQRSYGHSERRRVAARARAEAAADQYQGWKGGSSVHTSRSSAGQ